MMHCKEKNGHRIKVFAGSHNGFLDIGVSYSRQVIYVKGDFWIVKDNFEASDKHTYKQVWQGHYTQEKTPNLLRAVFNDASGCDLYQLNKIQSVTQGGARGKHWNIAAAVPSKKFEFITLIYPYKGASNRIDEDKENPKIRKWSLQQTGYKTTGDRVRSIAKNNEWYFFNVTALKKKGVNISFEDESDVFIKEKDHEIRCYNLSDTEIKGKILGGQIKDFVLKPGAFLNIPR